MLFHSDQVQAVSHAPDYITACLTALCGIAVREEKSEEEEEDEEEEEEEEEENVEITVWDTVTNLFQTNEEVT